MSYIYLQVSENQFIIRMYLLIAKNCDFDTLAFIRNVNLNLCLFC